MENKILLSGIEIVSSLNDMRCDCKETESTSLLRRANKRTFGFIKWRMSTSMSGLNVSDIVKWNLRTSSNYFGCILFILFIHQLRNILWNVHSIS